MASVTFPLEYGGDGKTYTDDADPNTGLDDLGYTVRFVPALAQSVAMGAYTKGRADAAGAFAAQCQSLREEVAADRTHVEQQRQATDTAAATATTKAGEASSSANAAADSASTAITAADTATTKAGEAATSATEAAGSASTASTAADTATTKAGAASDSASSASSSANVATTKASEALSSSNAASSSASTATSAANTATTKASEALSSSNAASSSASTATSAAETATTKAGEASSSAGAAAGSASTASTAANTATTKADDAASSANAASSSASTASTAAETASTKAGEASTSATSAANTLTDFLKRYLGPHATPPTTDNEGNPLLVGALYYSTVAGEEGMRQWTGASWESAYATIDGVSWSDVGNKPEEATRWPTVSEVTDLQPVLEAKLEASNVVDSLISESAAAPLSANQGRVLKGLIDSLNTLVASDDTTLDELQEIVDYIKVNRNELENLSVGAIAGLQTALDGKAATSHTHSLSEVTGSGTAAALNVAGTGNAAVGEVVKGDDTRLSDARAPTSHTHPWGQVTSKPATATRWPTFAEVTGKPNSYTSSSHTHSISNVTNLQSSLDAKRDTSDTSFPRYDLASTATTANLNLAQQQVFRVNASSARTLSFVNAPGANRAMTVVVHINGNKAVTWPASITWDDGMAPTLGAVFTRVVLFWDGAVWTGNARTRK